MKKRAMLFIFVILILSTVTSFAENPIKLKNVAVGEVSFGHYEQDNNLENGPEPIEWIVLHVTDDKALLLSKYGLDAKPYNTEWKDVSWETCTLRTWLNSDFLSEAFSKKERSAILTTIVDNSSSQGYSWWQEPFSGNDTQDQIFLLSYKEAEQYLNVTVEDENNIKSRVAPTSYAIAHRAWFSFEKQTEEGKNAGMWWLRSPGYKENIALCVYSDGSLFGVCGVFSDYSLVRPALWLSLKSII